MPTLDTAYVRSKYRGHGIGTEILNNLTEMFADEEIGFSAPISDGMSKGFNYLSLYLFNYIYHLFIY